MPDPSDGHGFVMRRLTYQISLAALMLVACGVAFALWASSPWPAVYLLMSFIVGLALILLAPSSFWERLGSLGVMPSRRRPAGATLGPSPSADTYQADRSVSPLLEVLSALSPAEIEQVDAAGRQLHSSILYTWMHSRRRTSEELDLERALSARPRIQEWGALRGFLAERSYPLGAELITTDAVLALVYRDVLGPATVSFFVGRFEAALGRPAFSDLQG